MRVSGKGSVFAAVFATTLVAVAVAANGPPVGARIGAPIRLPVGPLAGPLTGPLSGPAVPTALRPIPIASAAGTRAPTQPNAPRSGTIARIDAKAGKILVADKEMLIGPPYLAILDKRPNATGLLNVSALRAGMQIRYRVQAAEAPNLPRLVELWVLHDAASMQARNTTRTVK